MSDQQYEQITDLDELFGFSAAKKRAEECATSRDIYEEPSFIPHRVFLNQVDTYRANHISSFLTDQIVGTSKAVGDEGEGEEIIEESESKPKSPEVRYEIIGTLAYYFHKKSEDILFTINEKDANFVENIMKCGFVVYDITKDPNEISKALSTLTVIEQEIEKFKDVGPKTFNNLNELRVFILISTVMTWALTKPLDPEEPDTPFTEADYKKRKPHPNYKEQIACEREVILRGRKFKDKLKTIVVCSGIGYGAEEEDFTFYFKLAWNNEMELPIFQAGKNFVPLIHVKDLAKVIHGLLENPPRKQYILAIEQTPCKLKQIVKALNKAMGSGKTKDVSAEEAFLYPEITQTMFECYTVNLNMEPSLIVEEMEIEWQNELNLAENMHNIVTEFRNSRNLKTLKVILHGPPAVGKTRLAKKLCEHYGIHYICVKTIIEETLTQLNEKISVARAKLKAKEENANMQADTEVKYDAEEEEVEEEEGEEEDMIEEWEEQKKDIESSIENSENGRLPDDHVIRLIKKYMLANRCQNQGYVIDGYPKTIQQAKELFGQPSDGDEEEEPEDGTGGGNANKILPDFVLSLEATNEFLCQRIMAVPEHEQQGTHYTEENMLRRLETYRYNNTADNTMLNFFDEIEIHPIVINAMENEPEDTECIAAYIFDCFGPPTGFGMTVEEEIEMIRCQEENERLLEQEAQLLKEMLEKQAVETHQNKMQQWTELLEQLQAEEEKLLLVQGEPLRHYLIQFVFPTLTKGLLEVARVKPDDPVDFLAEYLFKQNPEGRMFDPTYTRDGELITVSYDSDSNPE